MAAIDIEYLKILWSDHSVATKEIAAMMSVTPSYITQIKQRLGLPDRPHGLAVCYSADGPAIGLERADVLARERSREAVELELRLLRERASCASYG